MGWEADFLLSNSRTNLSVRQIAHPHPINSLAPSLQNLRNGPDSEVRCKDSREDKENSSSGEKGEHRWGCFGYMALAEINRGAGSIN